MLGLILLLIVLSLPIYAIAHHVRSVRARAGAIRIISGEEPATDEQIDKIITRLLSAKGKWRNITEQDRGLVGLLYDLRKEPVTLRP